MDHLCACLGDLVEKLCSDAKPALEGPKAAEPPREAPKEAAGRAVAGATSPDPRSVLPLEVEKMEAWIFFFFWGGGGWLFKEEVKTTRKSLDVPLGPVTFLSLVVFFFENVTWNLKIIQH